MSETALTITLRAAALRLGIPERSLRRMAERRQFPAVKLGGVWRVTEKALARFLGEIDRQCEDNVVVQMRRRA